MVEPSETTDAVVPSPPRLTYVLIHEIHVPTRWFRRRAPIRPAVTVCVHDHTDNWEFTIEDAADAGQPGTRLLMFDDAYPALNAIPNLFQSLAREQPRTIAEVVALLDRIGAVDVTFRTT